MFCVNDYIQRKQNLFLPCNVEKFTNMMCAFRNIVVRAVFFSFTKSTINLFPLKWVFVFLQSLKSLRVKATVVKDAVF